MAQGMELIVLGSGSSGNGYLLSNGRECLILECGVAFREAKRALGWDTGIITGCLVTHEHGDHAAYAAEYAKNAADIYASAETLDAAGITGHRARPVAPGAPIRAGGFDLLPFEVMHDAAKPLGFMIRHADMGTLLFATDTYYLPNRFAGLNHIMIECSYAADIMEQNVKTPQAVKTRMLSSHMELETCKDFLRANDLTRVNEIVLLHVSRDNGDKRRFIDEIAGTAGKRVYAAEPGLALRLGTEDF